ncbi:hypothetical protein O6H91_03G075200 [Diphasiastrum complanatum]|uniref:Uncharacterized protein n=1 Tax=Diphasiastrum complanatum TaxID=34168 RepID=A0ACC2E863_DIPCM|nr:hypothetical protein O6H91_03G075200 [Diphasiastrum complanatum]
MQMLGSMALYSSSPPAAIWSSQVTAAQNCPSSSTFEIDGHTRSHLMQSSNAKPVRGGLSSLFASPSSRVSSSCAMEGLEASCLSSSLEDRHEGTENRCLGVNIWASGKTRERSPVSVLHAPLSQGGMAKRLSSLFLREAGSSGTGLSPLDPQSLGSSWRRSPTSVEIHLRHEGVEVNKAVRFPTLEVESNCYDSENSEDESSRNFENLSASVELCSSLNDWNRSSSSHSFADDLLFPRFAIETEVADLIEPDKVLEPREELTRMSELASSPLSLHQCSEHEHLMEGVLFDAQCRHKIFLEDFVLRAFKVAEEAHRGQLRRNGDMYLVHCVETAVILAEAGADSTIVAAGLLHDTVDDSNVDEQWLRSLFGDEVADLVIGVSKLSKFSQLARDNNTADNALEADRLGIMFLAMVDVRVVLIKLADRLHNLRTLQALPEEKQRRIANETLEIFTPIANRLGIWRWKAEMEDLCFKFLNPHEYQELATRLAESCREGVVMSAVQKLDQALLNKGLEFNDLSGRSKSLFSIHTKMSKKGRRIHEIYDVRGLRLIVPDIESCYAALDVVHELWNHVPGKLKDYIQLPKANGYQSLHTVVWGEDRLPLEVQIRTSEMHRDAEFGMAAHWRYKEDNNKHSSFLLQRVEWARWILTWHSELMDTKLRVSPSELDLRPPCPFPMHKSNCLHATMSYRPPQNDDDPLFIIMLKEEKMIVQELPPGSIAADLLVERRFFLNGVLHCPEVIPMVNQQTVNIQQKLQMGDLVELVAESSRSMTSIEGAKICSTPKVPIEMDISVYREQIRRMYEDSGRCKDEARRTSLSQIARETPVPSVL